MTSIEPLTPRQMAMLEFERHWWKDLGDRDTAIRVWFGLSYARYSQQVQRILDLPAAEVYDPLTVRALRRLQAKRQIVRGAKVVGFDLPTDGVG